MKTIFIGTAAFAAILILGILGLLGWTSVYLFKDSQLLGWGFIVPLIGCIILGFLRTIAWYKVSLPVIWQKLAEKNKFITLPKEKHWKPVERAGRFWFGIRCEDGTTSIDYPTERSHFSHPYIIRVEPDYVFDGLDLWLYRYFIRRGYIWLGFDANANSTVRIGNLKITKTKLQGEGDDLRVQNVGEVDINALRLTFNRYIQVSESETTDGYKMRTVCLAIVVVSDPYLAWYGLGGKAYETLDTRTQALVRSKVERHSLISFYAETDNAQDIVEEEIRGGDPTMPTLIGMAVTLSIEGWDDNAPPEFLEMIGRVQAIIKETQIAEAELHKAARIAEKQSEVYAAEANAEIERAKLEVKKAVANKKEYEAILAAAGGDAELATHLILTEKLGDQYTDYLRARALEKTSVQVLGAEALTMLQPRTT